jgi:hypothetical protein
MEQAMSNYIFVSPRSDPGMGHPLVDPMLTGGKRPTMGTCRPDLRRLVTLGGQIFVVSGSMGRNVGQYVIGGFEIDNKLEDQLEAIRNFPENRLKFDEDGTRHGNIIALPDGTQDPRDDHSKFESRIRNYVVGKNPIVLESPREVALGRERSVDILADVLDQPRAARVQQVIGRWRKLSDAQAERLRQALMDLKRDALR